MSHIQSLNGWYLQKDTFLPAAAHCSGLWFLEAVKWTEGLTSPESQGILFSVSPLTYDILMSPAPEFFQGSVPQLVFAFCWFCPLCWYLGFSFLSPAKSVMSSIFFVFISFICHFLFLYSHFSKELLRKTQISTYVNLAYLCPRGFSRKFLKLKKLFPLSSRGNPSCRTKEEINEGWVYSLWKAADSGVQLWLR